MKITLITQWFPPEQAPIGYMMKELAESLHDKGHDVTIVTGFPNHPAGDVFGGYTKTWCLREIRGGVKVERVWLATSANRSKLRRIWTFLTFTLTSSLALLRQKKVDVVFAVFQPLSMGVTLPLLSRIKGAKLVLNVQDLHPDVPVELGMIRNPLLIKALRAVERWGYRHADGLAVICESFKQHCVARGADAANVAVIPNWIDLNEIRPGPRNNPFRQALGLDEEHFVVLYAGTVGWVSGAEVMLEVARELESLERVRIVFVGEGPLVARLREEAADQGIGNMIFAPFQPRSSLPQVQAIADVSVVSLRAGKGRTSVPSKVLGYMAAARPVLAAVDADSETARIVDQSGCGWVVEPENPALVAAVIRRACGDSVERQRLGENGRTFLEQNFAQDTITGKYVEFLDQIRR